jgi:hypothetical protein
MTRHFEGLGFGTSQNQVESKKKVSISLCSESVPFPSRWVSKLDFVCIMSPGIALLKSRLPG